MTERERGELRQHFASWQFSQFLHGEQGAMICAARIVESVPDLDAKFYSATQTMDEARHAEIFARFLQEKIGMLYPINANLQALLGDTLRDSRWDMPYLGMQVLIEGLALAAFGMIRDMTTKPLPKQILAYVMQDEARHVAFGRMALRDYYKQLTDAELREREEFVIEGCYLMRDRLRGARSWRTSASPRRRPRSSASSSEYPALSGRCCSAASCRASRTSACGASGSSRPTSTWASSSWATEPRPADGPGRGDRRAARRRALRRRGGRPQGRGGRGDRGRDRVLTAARRRPRARPSGRPAREPGVQKAEHLAAELVGVGVRQGVVSGPRKGRDPHARQGPFGLRRDPARIMRRAALGQEQLRGSARPIRPTRRHPAAAP